MKQNYGPPTAVIRVRWKEGVFVNVDARQQELNLGEKETAVDKLFMKLLRRLAEEGRNVTDKTGTSYAPAIFAKQPEAKSAKVTNKAFAESMERLFAANKIRVDTWGPVSKERTRIVETTPFSPSGGPKPKSEDNAATEILNAASTDPVPPPSTDVPPPSTDASTTPPLYPPPGGSGAVGGGMAPPAPTGKERFEIASEADDPGLRGFAFVSDCPQSWPCSACGEAGNDQKGPVAKFKPNEAGAPATVLHEQCAATWFERH